MPFGLGSKFTPPSQHFQAQTTEQKGRCAWRKQASDERGMITRPDGPPVLLDVRL